MPKGGGAIRGIGEKFKSNPVTGTGSLSVPVTASPARNGFGPKLELAYDSGSGNGAFGIGWALPVQSITRKTDKGLPLYRDEDESDVFILSSSEDLVPAFRRNPDGTWAKDVGGAYALDEETRDGFRIKRYRPRVEGPFARIERWTRIVDGDAHWRSITKENVLTVYGGTQESRVCDPDDPRKVFSWLVCQTYDDKGNASAYSYATEDDRNVDLTQNNEANRIRTAARYLKKISYGNRRPLLLDPSAPSFRQPHDPAADFSDADWMFELVFSYGAGEYSEAAPDADGRVFASATMNSPAGSYWPARLDPFSVYRSGFEIRQYRLCRQVLLFHHFPNELGVDDCLVRSTDFVYTEKANGSYLAQIVQSGFKRIGATYLKRSLPPLEFDYSPSPLDDLTYDALPIQDVDETSLANMPFGVAGGGYRLADLDGEGIAGIFAEEGGAWFYKPNLGEGRFGPADPRVPLPGIRPNRAAAQLLDLAGDGRLDLVDFAAPTPGFFGRDDDAGWRDFRPFPLLPNVDWKNANLRFLDLTGDGHPDLLLTEDAVVSTWYESAAEDGFVSAQHVYGPLEEEHGPRYVFGDGTESIYTADMSGDGLSDIVRIRNGEVSYFPNLGYGRFGGKVMLDNVGWFDDAGSFDERRVHLTDTDGSGPTDIIYAGRDGVRVYLNEHGNSLSDPRHLERVAVPEEPAFLSVTDFLGRGTTCVVWSSALPSRDRVPMRFLDLMGGVKPHLLVGMRNNLGAETRIEYKSSTHFYLADKAAGTPWVTRLPFPVHVVARVESRDLIAGNRFSTTYTYHHGYFDGPEREFRGFGRVDQTDSEEFGVLGPASNLDEAFHVPPVLSKTWYHVGAYTSGERVSQGFAHEYYVAPGETPAEQRATLLDDTILPAGLTYQEAREAVRSLKGSILRQEIYALDGRPEPYSVSERNYTIAPLQPRGNNRFSVVFTHARETIDSQCERKLFPILGGQVAPPDMVAQDPPGLKWLFDPRIKHQIVLAVDDFGNVTKEASVAYGRKYPDPDPVLSDADRTRQAQILATIAESTYTNEVSQPDAYRTPAIASGSMCELIKVKPAAGRFFKFQEMEDIVATVATGVKDVPFEDVWASGALGPGPFRRMIKRERTRYRSNNLAQVLPDGKLQALGIESENYKLAFTPGMLAKVYKRPRAGQSPEDLLANPSLVLPAQPGKRDTGGYVDLDGDGSWWVPSGRSYHHPDATATPSAELMEACGHFFVPRRFKDPFGEEVRLDYEYDFRPVRSVDSLGNESRADFDYRVMQPRLVTDPNGNQKFVLFDALGMAVATALRGKSGEALGDSVSSFSALDTDPTASQVAAFAADPGNEAADLLGEATTFVAYDIDRFRRCGQPAFSATLSRETHVSDPAPPQGLRIRMVFVYSDGFGRELQTKLPAEPGTAPSRAANAVLPTGDVAPGALNLDGAGKLIFAATNPRWIAKGRTVFNNKGKPVKQYEPFFSSTYLYESEEDVTDAGVTPIMLYDPLSRLVAALHPSHTFEKVVFDPWRQDSWDRNDTALISDPKTDEDVGAFFVPLPEHTYLPSWHDRRINGQLGTKQRECAEKTAAHAATPATSLYDPLGRPIATIADNGPDGGGHTLRFATRVLLDVEGNEREIRDAKNRLAMRFEYDMLARRLSQASMESGQRWTLGDIDGKEIRAWGSRGHTIRKEYDALRRPSRFFVLGADPGSPNTEFCFETTVYGEDPATGLMAAEVRARNLRTRPYRHFDTSGVVGNEQFDFKGNLLRSTRQLLADYKSVPDWLQAPSLDGEIFSSSSMYDALNRPVQRVEPHSDSPGTKVNTVQPRYNEANMLESLPVWLSAAAEPGGLLDPTTADETIVSNVDYDARGQRLSILYGNGVTTEYTYDPETFKMVRLKTTGNRQIGGFLSGFLGMSSPVFTTFQDLSYVYDPAGNLTSSRDDAQQPTYFAGQVAQPESDFVYDPLYRLISASGREHIGQAGTPQTTWDDAFRVRIPSPTDPSAMRPYVEQYAYDEVGNFMQLVHQAAGGNWTRSFAYTEPSQVESGKSSNRLSGTRIGAFTETYGFDEHGSVVTMPHLSSMSWDFLDRLASTSRQVVNASPPPNNVPETTYYVYDASGRRTRKVTERQNGTRKEERIYFDGFEVYRRFQGNGTAVALARESVHVSDDRQRVALIESRVAGNDGSPARLVRYQLTNHLGSACIELDPKANPISYEEYYPFGATSYQSVDQGLKAAAKRYRYSSKERDEESGLNFHEARYYATWIPAWIATDPIGIKTSANLYLCMANRPTTLTDPGGRSPAAGPPGPPPVAPFGSGTAGSGPVVAPTNSTVSAPSPPDQPSWFQSILNAFKTVSNWIRDWLPGIIAAPLAGLVDIVGGLVRFIGGVIAWKSGEVLAGLKDMAGGALSMIGFKEFVFDDWINPTVVGVHTTTLKMPRSMAQDIADASHIQEQVSPDAYKNGMHAWHAATNAHIASRLGIVGAAFLWIAGLVHESPIDYGSFRSEQAAQGTVNHILDSSTDIVANTWGIFLGLLLPRRIAVKAAAFTGDYIPGPGDPDPAGLGTGGYTGNPVDAWGQYPHH